MKNIFKIKSLLFFVMIMVLFATNLVLGDSIKTRQKSSNRRQQNKRNKKRINSHNRNKKNKKKKSENRIINLDNVAEETIGKFMEKAVMSINPEEIYKEGLAYIDELTGDEKSENSIQVGNYYLDIPNGMAYEDAKKIVNDKLSYLLSLTMTAACNNQFNLGALAILLNTDNDYSEIKKSNEHKIKAEIENTDFYKLSMGEEVNLFIKKAILLELKSLLNPTKKESYFKSWFKGKSLKTQLKEFIKNNHIFKEIEVLKTIRAEDGLEEEVVYLVTAMAYYIKNNDMVFLKSPLFQDLVHAMTIPLNFKLAKVDEAGKINHAAHREMREIYKKTLKLYDISKIAGLQESRSAQFIVESTAYYVIKKALQTAGVLGTTALLAGGVSAAKNLYYRDEKDKDKSKWDIVKEGGKKDLEFIKEHVKSGAHYISDGVAEGYDRAANFTEKTILRREKGRRDIRDDIETAAKETAAKETAAKETAAKEAAAKEAAAKEAEANATLFSEIADYSEKQWKELGKYIDSYTPEQKEAILTVAAAVGMTPLLYAGARMVKNAGGVKAVFNATKTKGKAAWDEGKNRFDAAKKKAKTVWEGEKNV